MILALADLNTARSQDPWFKRFAEQISPSQKSLWRKQQRRCQRDPRALMALTSRLKDCSRHPSEKPLPKHCRNTQWPTSSSCVPNSQRENAVCSQVGVGCSCEGYKQAVTWSKTFSIKLNWIWPVLARKHLLSSLPAFDDQNQNGWSCLTLIKKALQMKTTISVLGNGLWASSGNQHLHSIQRYTYFILVSAFSQLTVWKKLWK